ncbi:acyl-CoA dehydrogenase family protein [Rhodococcus koreensis]
MDFSYVDFSQPELEFAREIADFFDTHLTPDVIAQERRTGDGHNHDFHKSLGDKGWIMPTWPVEAGGAGLDPVQSRLLQLERDRREIPGVTHSTTRLSTAVVQAFGSETLKAKVLPGVACGEVKICLGYTEPDGGSDLAAVRTRATAVDGHWRINGAKMFTTGAHNCQYSLLVARTDPDAPKHHGITIFLVPLDGPGVEIQPIATLGGERTNSVFYDDVFVDDDYRLGPVNQGWSVMSAPLDAEHGIKDDDGLGEINGGAPYGLILRKLLWHATRWAKTAAADGCRPIDDPLIGLTLARIAVDVELVRNAKGAMGRVLGSDLLIKKSAELLDLIGPAALLPEGVEGAIEDGIFEWGHRFAQGTAIYGGTTDIARNIIAQHVLKLPRPPKPSSPTR